ncbi:MAG: hypothetical protein KA508_03930 [Gammaproteobacteria bacterium]|nr:hypothetical protein [Gammaproteobacteria bacterium]
MDLQDILEKNKHKLLKLAPFKMPAPPSIAMEDRPYSDIDLKVNLKTHKKPIATGKQTGSKQVANSKQIVTRPELNGKQTGNKLVTNGKQTGNKRETNGKQTGNKPVTEQVTNITTNRKQTGNTSQEKTLFTRLVGIQRNIVLFFYFLAKRNISQSTNPLSMDYISKSLNIGKGVAKTTIVRLQKKGCLTRHLGKEGRGGWSSFTIASELYQDMMQQERQGFLDSVFHQTGNKLVTEQVTEQVTSGSSSSSYINTTTEINIHTAREELPEAWRAVDYSVLAHIDFNMDHLLQLCQRGTLEPEVVQDSLYHFAFDLRHNKKREAIKGDPLNYLMGVLAKRPYTAPTNYVDPNVEAFNRYAKDKAKQNEQLQVLEANVQNSEFQSWYEHLPQNELDTLCSTIGEQSMLPDALQKTIKTRHLRKHFNEVVWPDVRRRLRSMQTS